LFFNCCVNFNDIGPQFPISGAPIPDGLFNVLELIQR
jgi:hypothetical protein